MENKARRYNSGKTRYELIPHFALNQLADVYTRGAHKYSIYEDANGNKLKGSEIPLADASSCKLIEDGADNWRSGLSWTGALDSVKRHIEAYRNGEDYDKELGTLHLANAAWGLFALMEYYKIYPQGDDRKHAYLNRPKIGLDIDDVLSDFCGKWCSHFNAEMPESWGFDRNIGDKFSSLDKDFWLSIEPKVNPSDIPFEPHCYITSRSIPIEWTIEWLDKNKFPTAPVYSIGFDESKVDVAKKSGCDIFVDDRYENFVELNKNGICCYLYDMPHNRRYDVGYKRIKSLNELI